MSALSSNSLIVSLNSNNIADHPFKALVDSSSTHCFIDTHFATKHKLCSNPIPPITLRLFDGTSNSVITQAITLQITFSSGEKHEVLFYVTPLDSSCSVVLGHNWLTHYNPSINWVLGNILFETTPHALSSSPMSPPLKASASLATPISDPREATPKLEAPKIAFIKAAAFTCICRMDSTEVFQLALSEVTAKARSATSVASVDLSSIPKEYHDFPDVFNKEQASMLNPHRPYNLKIKLEDRQSPLIGLVYSISQTELQLLCEFLNEHLAMGFIQPSLLPHGAPVLFA